MHRFCLLLASLLAAGSAGSAVAQPARYRELTAERLPELFGQCMDADAGDVDGDGDLDLALAMEFAPNLLLLNDGTGRFVDAPTNLPRTVHDSEDIAFADFDGDGAMELLLCNRSSNPAANAPGGRQRLLAPLD